MYSDSPEDAFERGAGASLESVNSLFTNVTTATVMVFVVLVILSAYLAWRNGKLPLGELFSSIVKSVFFIVILLTFVGVVSTTATFK